MKLKEKKKLEQYQNSEKNSKNPYIINSTGKWLSENEQGKQIIKINFLNLKK